MKLRLRFINCREPASRTICIDAASDCSIQDIKNQHNLTVRHGISLNGHDTLDDEKKLAELGVVSGDLLYVMSSEDDVELSIPAAEVSAASSMETLSQPTVSSSPSSSGTPLETQSAANMDTISTDSPSSAKRPHTADLESGNADVACAGGSLALEPSMECDTAAAHEDYQRVADTLQRELESECCPVDGYEINRYLREPHLCSESTDSEIPQRLTRMLRRERVQTSAEVLCIALNLMMLECGFSLHYNQAEEETVEVKRDDPSSERPLPRNWSVTPGVYRLTYQYSGLPGTSLAVVTMGTHLLIHGQFSLSGLDDDDKHFELDVQTSHYVTDTVSDSGGSMYRHLPLLTRQFKDGVAWPLVKEIRTALELPPLTGILALPQELQVQILSVFLDVASLLRLSEVSRAFKLISRDPFIWRLAYVRKFGKRSEMDLNQDWFQLFKTSYLKTKELLRYYQKMDRILFMPDWLRRRQPYPLVPGAPTRGILGGDYDLHPGFHGNQGMFPPGRGYFPPNAMPHPLMPFAPHMPQPIINPLAPFPLHAPRPIIDPDVESPLLDMHEDHERPAMQNTSANSRRQNQLFPNRGPLRLL